MCKYLLAVLALLTANNMLKAQCLGSCCSAGCSTNITNQTESNHKGDWQISTGYYIMQYDPFTDNELKQWSTEDAPVFTLTSQQSVKLGLQYNITDRWKVSAIMPYNFSSDNREGHSHEGDYKEVHNYGNVYGYGDATFIVKYRWLRLSDNAWCLETGLGIKIPSGQTNTVSSNNVIVPPNLQPGTGSWDPVASVLIRKRKDRWIFSEDVFTKIATTANDHNMGDYVSATTAASYQLIPPSSHVIALSLLAGLQLEYNSKMKMPIDHVHGTETMTDTPVPFDNSGFTRLLFSAGTLIYAGKHFTIPLSFSFPVYEHLNGYQVSMNWKTMLGLNINL